MILYPFTAVVGQESFKQALLLNAVDPKIGGVLVSGPRGCAKSTLARAMVELLPKGVLVNLPLGTSEEMLCGTLDLQQALSDKSVSFKPGLLSKADGGLLYIDEVNLLSDRLVDLLLDAAASGINHVERDGISHQHACRFMLVGTMNPDEGEVRDQLKDRFGLSVALQNETDINARVLISERRSLFEHNPHALIAQFAEAQQQVRTQISAAQACLPDITLNKTLLRDIAKRCIAANVDGMRADIVWSRAAKAHAALAGRIEVQLSDIDATEALVLAHRRNSPNEPPSPPQTSKRPPDSKRQDTELPPNSPQQGDWGAMEEFNHTQSAQLHSRSVKPANAGLTLTTNQIDWPATLASSQVAPVEREQIERVSKLNLVLLDTSGSTLKVQQGADVLAYARGFVEELAQNAYLQRQRLTLFGFGNDAVELLAQTRRPPKSCASLFDTLSAGGGTPLTKALEAAQNYIKQLLLREPNMEVETFVLTDGRYREHPKTLPFKGVTHVIDLEQSELRIGKSKQLAEQLHAHYLPLF